MRFNNLSDSHVHSSCSFDAESTVDEMCRQALAEDLYSVTFTDHCECPEFFNPQSEYGDFTKSVAESFALSQKAKENFLGRLLVLSGIELGEPLHNYENTKAALNSESFDFVLASVHNLYNRKDFYFLEYEADKVDKVLKDYFAELYDTAKWGGFDSLAHLTYPLRYIVGRSKIPVCLNDYVQEIDLILKELVKNEKALEVNVSGLRNEICETMPNFEIIKRFKDLGGKYVTLGGDAHRASDLGKGLAQGANILLKAGFKEYTIYKEHKPVLLEIR